MYTLIAKILLPAGSECVYNIRIKINSGSLRKVAGAF